MLINLMHTYIGLESELDVEEEDESELIRKLLLFIFLGAGVGDFFSLITFILFCRLTMLMLGLGAIMLGFCPLYVEETSLTCLKTGAEELFDFLICFGNVSYLVGLSVLVT